MINFQTVISRFKTLQSFVQQADLDSSLRSYNFQPTNRVVFFTTIQRPGIPKKRQNVGLVKPLKNLFTLAWNASPLSTNSVGQTQSPKRTGRQMFSPIASRPALSFLRPIHPSNGGAVGWQRDKRAKKGNPNWIADLLEVSHRSRRQPDSNWRSRRK
ncbi:hypothetical protein BC567DRAFT_228805 [Phyllosticta citribraziliensis]